MYCFAKIHRFLPKSGAAVLTGKPSWEFYNLYYRQFAEVLVRMEHRGMLLDREHLAKMKAKGEKMLKDCDILFREHLGALVLPDGTPVVSDPAAFNPASSKQLRQLYFLTTNYLYTLKTSFCLI